jgi:hypothetical protein
MTAAREWLRRWITTAYVVGTFTLAAVRHVRRGRHRRAALREVDVWPW